MDLDELNSQWRLAIHSAQDALHTVSESERSLGFVRGELREFNKRLLEQKTSTARLLDRIAREERLPLRRELDAPWAERGMLGLGDGIDACVFDLDGVLTGSAEVHAEAWADTLDPLLSRRAERSGERYGPYKPFTPQDYVEYLHARPRLEGIHAFLASRGIRLREGEPSDPPGTETIWGLANRKNEALLHRLADHGVAAFEGSLLYLLFAAEAGVERAVVTPSANGRAILGRSGLSGLVGPLVDGNTMQAKGLRRKPAPDTLEEACEELGFAPTRVAAFETTAAGVRAARDAGFGLVVGVERPGQSASLDGADLIVRDLAQLLDPALRR